MEINLTKPSQTLRLSLRGEDTMKVVWDGEVVRVVPAGSHALSVRLPGGVVHVESKKPFVGSYRVTGTDDEEIGEWPMPDPVGQMNILRQMREEFRRQLGVMREPFDTDAPWPGHEIDDDEDYLFEEDLAQKAKDAKVVSDHADNSDDIVPDVNTSEDTEASEARPQAE